MEDWATHAAILNHYSGTRSGSLLPLALTHTLTDPEYSGYDFSY